MGGSFEHSIIMNQIHSTNEAFYISINSFDEK